MCQIRDLVDRLIKTERKYGNPTMGLYIFEWNSPNFKSHTPSYLEEWTSPYVLSNKNIYPTFIPSIDVEAETCGSVICVRSRPAVVEMLSGISGKYTGSMTPSLKMLPRIQKLV